MSKEIVMATNNAYDTVLLLDGDKVLSVWTAGACTVGDYLRDGANAAAWGIHATGGIEIYGRPACIADYGRVIGRNGVIEDAGRAEYWRAFRSI